MSASAGPAAATSRAWVLDAPETLRERTLALAAPVPWLRVAAVGLCGTDVHALRGHLPLAYPVVLGHEIVGRLSDDPAAPRFVLAPSRSCEECAACVAGTPDRCGARVTYGLNVTAPGPASPLGGFSEYVALLPGFRLVPVPDDLPTEVSVLTEPLACVLSALRRAEAVWPLGGTEMAVIGAGPVGLLTAVAATVRGARVVVVEARPSRRRLAAALGLHAVDPADTAPLVERMDHVIDCAGSVAAVECALGLARRGGVVVVFGTFSATGTVALSPAAICNRELSVLGASTTNVQDYTIALRLLRWNVERFRPIVTHQAPLFGADPLPNLFELMERGECGKICLLP